jgi:hypothetical protein
MSNTSETLTNLVTTFNEEYVKFSGGNSAAGTRARKALGEITKLARATRKSIQEEKNARKKKA